MTPAARSHCHQPRSHTQIFSLGDGQTDSIARYGTARTKLERDGLGASFQTLQAKASKDRGESGTARDRGATRAHACSTRLPFGRRMDGQPRRPHQISPHWPIADCPIPSPSSAACLVCGNCPKTPDRGGLGSFCCGARALAAGRSCSLRLRRAMAKGGAAMGLALLAALLCAAAAALPRLEHPAKTDGSLSLLVVGDWGRKGMYNQSRVAEQMGRVGEKLDIDFVVSTGDNFYDTGLTGVDDHAFEQSFTDIYTAKSLQKPWYLVLGNHDYKSNALAQLSPVLRKIDSRFICMRSFIVNAEIADFFFIDTTPFQLKYWTHPKGNHYDWRGVAPREKYITNLLKDLDKAMKKSTAKWKIAVGHHTMRSVSHHGDTEELLQLLLPILKVNSIDFYINGHDHCLEHISSRDSPIQYFTSGGGSRAWRGFFQPNEDSLRFFYDGQGFMSLQLHQDQADFIFYDVDGNILYQYSQWSLRKAYLPTSFNAEE